jgi:hypothetical protein
VPFTSTLMRPRCFRAIGSRDVEDLAALRPDALPIELPGMGSSFSSPGWTRTNNPPVNSRMLCQLSYRGTVCSAVANCSGAIWNGRAGKAATASLVGAAQSAP